MQVFRLPPGNMSSIIQIIQIIPTRHISALKALDHEMAIEVSTVYSERQPGPTFDGRSDR